MSDIQSSFVSEFVDSLIRLGIENVCVCPGSRSTPLALTFRRDPRIKVWMHVDERSAAYFALGIAKRSKLPVAVVSTSGTAAVNFAPAAVEAFFARVPLLLLTADRPAYARDIGTNQTIDQVRLYGSHVKWSVDVQIPDDPKVSLAYAKSIAGRSMRGALEEPAGPVHLNFPFREPLLPEAGKHLRHAETGGQENVFPTNQPPGRYSPEDFAPLRRALHGAERPLIVCGEQDDPSFPDAVTALAREIGAPVLADPLSQVRCGPQHSSIVIDAYDAFLRDEEIARRLSPDFVLRFGAAPVSKALLQFLERNRSCNQVLADPGGSRDPTLSASDVVRLDPALLCRAVLDGVPDQPAPTLGPGAPDWVASWTDTNTRVRSALAARIEQERGLSEPGVFADLNEVLPAGGTLFAGNSMPIRDLDAMFPGGTRDMRFLANRGASGIDGVVSTALGVSAVSEGPLVLVIGDLSFYHDMNGLLAARRYGLSATIVLVNNDGGGIFSMLPQSSDPHFEEVFATPTGLDFKHTADMYGLEYHCITSRQEFRDLVSRSFGSEGVTLLEVRTDRGSNAKLHRELMEAAALAGA
ncbi:MAG: 2-succinyl-5-enolpyruvyl-6-hydroxy-3-cyclohexene-1-carboxylic-acid synthase [Chloroflexi bacterium]|nr:2-succinyl-5-enolpyruvyl-6-hydroxy-3-cyclohexene-1-carboxylic-acid synthase [Chloroflexota bacterium]